MRNPPATRPLSESKRPNATSLGAAALSQSVGVTVCAHRIAGFIATPVHLVTQPLVNFVGHRAEAQDFWSDEGQCQSLVKTIMH